MCLQLQWVGLRHSAELPGQQAHCNSVLGKLAELGHPTPDKLGLRPTAPAKPHASLRTVQREGREAVRRAGGVGVLVKLLLRDALGPKVRQRVVGALHNLSSEADAVRLVREQGGIPPLAAVLRCADAGTAAAAVGALQNLSREAASCGVLLEQEGAVEALAELLASEDVQVCTSCSTPQTQHPILPGNVVQCLKVAAAAAGAGGQLHGDSTRTGSSECGLPELAWVWTARGAPAGKAMDCTCSALRNPLSLSPLTFYYMQVAACAAGVLLNMHKLSRGKGSVADQESLTKGLTGVLSAAAIYGSLFRAPPCVRTDPPAQV